MELQSFTTELGWALATLATLLTMRMRRMANKEYKNSVENNHSDLLICSRKSDLAMVQTWHIQKLLTERHPGLNVKVQKGVQSFGDKTLGESLKDLAAKTPGVFTKELEAGLLSGQYDAVVHCLKDMPTTLPDGLILAAITEREDPHDALVVHKKHLGKGGLAGLPKGAKIGTSSVRREAIILRDYPHLKVDIVRGNLSTRLAKLDSGEFDAIILAVAGLKRLGPSFENRIEEVLTPPKFMYSVGQGALGLQCRANDERTIKLLKSLSHPETTARCLAERALLRALQGGCQIPLGVSSNVLQDDKLELACIVLQIDGSSSVEKAMIGSQNQPEALGEALAKELLSGGAGELLKTFRTGEIPRPLTYGSMEEPNIDARQPRK